MQIEDNHEERQDHDQKMNDLDSFLNPFHKSSDILDSQQSEAREYLEEETNQLISVENEQFATFNNNNIRNSEPVANSSMTTVPEVMGDDRIESRCNTSIISGRKSREQRRKETTKQYRDMMFV